MTTRVWALCLIAGMAGALAVLALFDPQTSALFPPCPFYASTGLDCPGCGSLRTLHHLLNGDLRGALAFNPLAVVALPFWIAMAARPRWFTRPWVAWVSFAILVVYGVVRNIPVWPFTWLAAG